VVVPRINAAVERGKVRWMYVLEHTESQVATACINLALGCACCPSSGA
jgi:hypothetical protein